MARKKNTEKQGKPRVNPEIEGFDIKIDSFGELKSNFDIDRINEFLNENVEDKKLKDRDDLDFIKKKKDQDNDHE